jgi:ABC-2 type transport system permease protein
VNALAIAEVNVRRLLRDRTSTFFIFVLPIVLIVVLGTVFGGRVAPRMGIVAVESGALGAELVDAIRNGAVKLELKEPATVAELTAGVEEGTLEIGVIIPPGYDATVRGGGVAEIVILGQPQSAVSALREAVSQAVAAQAAVVQAARLTASRGPTGPPEWSGGRSRRRPRRTSRRCTPGPGASTARSRCRSGRSPARCR